MNLASYRSQFTIFINMSDMELAAQAKGALSALGYECYTFSNLEVLKERLNQARPHILIQHIKDMGLNVGRFLSEIREDAPELLLICVGDLAERGRLSKYFDFGIHDHVATGENFSEATVWSVDRAVQSLVYLYQNEQLIEKSGEKEEHTQVEEDFGDASSPQAQYLEPMTDDNSSRLLAALGRIHLALSRCHDQEELIEALMIHWRNNLGKDSGDYLYFRFIPSAFSFVVTHFNGILPGDTKGVGFKLNVREATHFDDWLKQPNELDSLRTLLLQAFDIDHFEVDLVRIEGQLGGIFVCSHESDFEIPEHSYRQVSLALFEQRLNLLHFGKQIRNSEVRDELTGAFVQHQMRPKLTSEIARSRRLKLPVSMILCQIDREAYVRSQLSEEQIDYCVKNIADMILRSSRVNDYTFRTGEMQFTLVLPHSPGRGAAIRAERLRRMIESTPFTPKALHFTASFGVAEYPSHALSADDMKSLAGLAVEQVQLGGGNKVCLATPPPHFKADFVIENS